MDLLSGDIPHYLCVTVHAPEGPLQFVLERDDTTLHGRATNTRTFPVRIARAGGRLARKTNGGDGAQRRTENRTGQSPQDLFQLVEAAIVRHREAAATEARRGPPPHWRAAGPSAPRTHRVPARTGGPAGGPYPEHLPRVRRPVAARGRAGVGGAAGRVCGPAVPGDRACRRELPLRALWRVCVRPVAAGSRSGGVDRAAVERASGVAQAARASVVLEPATVSPRCLRAAGLARTAGQGGAEGRTRPAPGVGRTVPRRALRIAAACGRDGTSGGGTQTVDVGLPRARFHALPDRAFARVEDLGAGAGPDVPGRAARGLLLG